MSNRDEDHFFQSMMNVLIEKWMRIILLVVLVAGGLVMAATAISAIKRSFAPLVPPAQKAERQ